ncbi:MAG: selenocysteine lyase/cysteine desulfurase [Flavobacteriaceae bacterium]|jgi:selenocysteine lyase/cysteine desulfurase
MIDFKKEFPVLERYTYLNAASCGLISRSLVAWRHEQDTNLLQEGSVFRDLHKLHIESIRTTVANFFKASENEVGLIPNFSFGFNSLLDGLTPNLKVLLLKSDYPSINWAVENRDFDVCYADVNQNLEENIETAIQEQQPDVIAFSLVQYITGIKIDLAFVKRLKAYHPNLIIIADGTQFLGTSDFNFSESGLDVLIASCYKWLLAGYGNAIIIVKEGTQKKISPKVIGFNSSDAVFSRRDDITFVKRFEPGHQDTLNYGSLQKSLELLERIGMNVIEEKINLLGREAKKRFEELDLLDEAVIKREQHSSIFNLRAKNGLFQKFKESNIICSQRGNGIRVSFHFYNSLEDLDKLIEVINANE